MGSLLQWASVNSRLIKILTAFTLAAVVALAYLLLIIIFMKPESLLLDSLLQPANDTTSSAHLTPQVAVALLSAVLTGGTITLVTRSVDEYIWRELTPPDNQARLTIAEARGLAQWSISAAARVRYLGRGDSWTLRLAGIFLLTFAGVSPVLLKGISQQTTSTFVTKFAPRNASLDPFAGFLDSSLEAHWGGDDNDLPGEAAFLTSLSALNAPASDICTDSLCAINARIAGFQANCTSQSFPNPDSLGTQSGPLNESTPFCSAIRSDLCVNLVSGDPATSAKFVSAAPEPEAITDGHLTVIFGVYVHEYHSIPNSDLTIYTVDCDVRYGFVNITQNGTSAPIVNRASFTNQPTAELNTSSMDYLTDVYWEGGGPWTFSGGRAGASSETLFSYPVGAALIGESVQYTGPEVASRVESAWDMDDIFALSRVVTAADVATTVETRQAVYVYDARVLSVLIVPLLATILGLWGRWFWRVQGEELMLGYDPVKIARCGPVYGVPPGLDEEGIDRLKVVRYLQVQIDENGQEMRYYQIIASGVVEETGGSVGGNAGLGGKELVVSRLSEK